MNPSTFHPFPRLPLELRNQIWGECQPAARIINFPIYGPALYQKSQFDYHNYTLRNLRTESHPTTDPILLLVCRESRAFTLQYYHLRKHFSARSSNFVNFQRDTFALHFLELKGQNHVLETFTQEADWTLDYEGFGPGFLNPSKSDLEKIRHLVLNISFHFFNVTNEEDAWKWLKLWVRYLLPLFTSLEDFKIGVLLPSEIPNPGAIVGRFNKKFLQFAEQEEGQRREWLKSVLVVNELAWTIGY